jgi:hypothetical protein
MSVERVSDGGKDSGLCRIRHKPESLPPSNPHDHYGALRTGFRPPRIDRRLFDRPTGDRRRIGRWRCPVTGRFKAVCLQLWPRQRRAIADFGG